MIDKVQQTQTDSLIILKNGKIISELYSQSSETLYDLKSATKSIVSLAIGILIHDKKIRSIDDLVCQYLPEWRKVKVKNKISIRDILAHTSGLKAKRTGIEVEISPDIVQQALVAPLIDQPGKHFFYNNKAVNLLPEIIKRVSGKNIELFLKERLFEPLYIKKYHWKQDQFGNYPGYGALELSAYSLAKIGQMLLQNGVWNGKQIIDRSWIDQSMKTGSSLNPSSGLLWWRVLEYNKSQWTPELLSKYRKVGVSPILISQLEALKGAFVDWRDESSVAKVSPFLEQLHYETESKHLEGLDLQSSEGIGYFANGWLGQTLLVIPQQQLVVIRQSRYQDLGIISLAMQLSL